MSGEKPLVLQAKAFIKMIHWMAQFANFNMEMGLWVEAMGIMFCKETADKYVIVDAEGITSGNLVYVETSPQQIAEIVRIEDQLKAEDPNIFAGGWFHSHPGHGLFFSGTDTANQAYWQNSNPNGVGLVFDLTQVSENFIGFKFFRLDAAQAHSYHEVPYTLYGFTEETLIEAFKPLGIELKIIHRLAKNLGLKSAEGVVEFEKIEVPETDDPENTGKEYAEKAEFEYKHGNIKSAVEKYRIANLLLKRAKNVDFFDLYLKVSIKLAKLCVLHDYPETANQLINEIKVFSQKMNLKPNYYVGKTEILLGYLAELEKDYQKAKEHYIKAKNNFEKGKIYYNISKAAELTAAANLRLNEKEKAIKNLKDALYNITMAEKLQNSKKSQIIWNVLKKGLTAKIKYIENVKKESGIEKID
ncbi:MAG: Mov34/MPN/PAD-1 family protein [Promethearchaeota archaeon]